MVYRRAFKPGAAWLREEGVEDGILLGTDAVGRDMLSRLIFGARYSFYVGIVVVALAAFIGALSGVLISPITTLYFDSGFIISLKGFVGAIAGGLIIGMVTHDLSFSQAVDSYLLLSVGDALVAQLLKQRERGRREPGAGRPARLPARLSGTRAFALTAPIESRA